MPGLRDGLSVGGNTCFLLFEVILKLSKYLWKNINEVCQCDYYSVCEQLSHIHGDQKKALRKVQANNSENKVLSTMFNKELNKAVS